MTGLSWPKDKAWFEALGDRSPGDIKVCWEAARFPQAYHFSRASAFFPDRRDAYASALWKQMQGFSADNPIGKGIHWASGQEIAFRLLAWIFGTRALLLHTDVGAAAAGLVGSSLIVGARYIEQHIDYARHAVYNNHLISEALALYAAGCLLPEVPDSARWRSTARQTLTEQTTRQFYADGGYIQQSHNYHRLAIQDYLWALVFARAANETPPGSWIDALERSLTFLHANQNPSDGRLPNYGGNDGALPSLLSCCDFSDMRPTLQAASVACRGKRLYDAGQWDEEAAWLFGVDALGAPLETVQRSSVSFAISGHHVLRGSREDSFATFRCGTLRDRFSQIDMLHVDIWWKGHNVLVDGGSYLYNGDPKWLAHFMRTPSHNTIALDGRDQMLHYRPFKVIYLNTALLQSFEDAPDRAMVRGEHYGYVRHAGRCIHQRTVYFGKDDLWVIVDRITGEGSHDIHLHWLGGDFPHSAAGNGMSLETPAGVFSVSTFDDRGLPAEANVARGVEDPPRGWYSRYYGDKVAVPSLVVRASRQLPARFITILGPGQPQLRVNGSECTVTAPGYHMNFGLP
ncbi:MAG: heparinase II/III family protein [Cyanobacteria bacterium]|nr:heparinase II/III family protein [Cyanobacteriota bacterium]